MTYEKLITPDDIEICYEVIGKDKADPPILLLSGAGLQMLGWPDEFCRMLASKRRVIRFDNRDTGESTLLKHLPVPAPWKMAAKHKLGLGITPPYTLEDMARDVEHLLEGLDIPKAHLVGISLGSMIAQVVAINSAHRVASLVCIATQARNSRHTMPRIGTVVKLLRSPRPGRQGYIDWTINLVRAVGGSAAEGPDDYLRELAGRMFDRGIYDDGLKRHVCAVYASPDRREALSQVKVPTLVLHGVEDPLIHLEASREVAAAIDGARFVAIEGMGHGVLQPSWPRLVEAIEQHLESVA